MTATPDEGCSFAEDPNRAAPDARILFEASTDPSVLACEASAGEATDPDLLETGCFSTLLSGRGGGEQLLLSDGLHNLRLEIRHGSLLNGPVRLHFKFDGLAAIDSPLLTLRRLVALQRLRRMPLQLYRPDPGARRAIVMMRAWDAHAAGASQREIAALLFGTRNAESEWRAASDYLRSRVRRLVANARGMVRGDWRALLKRAVR